MSWLGPGVCVICGGAKVNGPSHTGPPFTSSRGEFSGRAWRSDRRRLSVGCAADVKPPYPPQVALHSDRILRRHDFCHIRTCRPLLQRLLHKHSLISLSVQVTHSLRVGVDSPLLISKVRKYNLAFRPHKEIQRQYEFLQSKLLYV